MAYKKIQFKRGTKTGMPVLRAGEPGFTQDEKSFYVGDGTSNQRFLNETQTNTRIDEKIAPVTQSITSNVATLNQTINTKETTLNGKINEKVKVNDTPQNVNFIRNQGVQDTNKILGLSLVNVNSKIDLGIKGGWSYFKINTTFTSSISSEIFGNMNSNQATSGGFSVRRELNGIYLVCSDGNTVTTYRKTQNTLSKEFTVLVYDTGNSVKVFVNDIVLEGNYKATSTNYYLGKNTTETSNELFVCNFYMNSSRELTIKEITYNLSVINNTPSINKINDYAISTDTDHVTDRTGRVQESINRVFYKNMCKEFTSNGEAITVNNGMDGYVLSGKIEGQTVKRILQTNCWYGNTGTGDFWAISYDKTKYDNGYYVFNNTDKPISVLLKKWIDDSYIASVILQTGKFCKLDIGYIDQIRCYISDGFSQVQTQATKDYITNNVIVCSNNCINSYIPFGLSSTQAVVTANGMKYSFYLNNEDKLAGKVIDLDGLDGARNTLEIKEDGHGVLTSLYKEKIITENAIIVLQSDFLNQINTIGFRVAGLFGDGNSSAGKVDSLSMTFTNYTQPNLHANDVEGFTIGYGMCYFRINKSKLATPDVEGVKEWLKSNPITVRYQLATPIVTTIPKELIPAILTQATNTFTFGDGVMATKATISVPVNRIAEMQAQLDEIKALIQTPSNINLTMNYIEDEYNKNQSIEGVM